MRIGDGMVLVTVFVPECSKHFRHRWRRMNESNESPIRCFHCKATINYKAGLAEVKK